MLQALCAKTIPGLFLCILTQTCEMRLGPVLITPFYRLGSCVAPVFVWDHAVLQVRHNPRIWMSQLTEVSTALHCAHNSFFRYSDTSVLRVWWAGATLEMWWYLWCWPGTGCSPAWPHQDLGTPFLVWGCMVRWVDRKMGRVEKGETVFFVSIMTKTPRSLYLLKFLGERVYQYQAPVFDMVS